MTKRVTKRLSLDADAVARAERYCERHSTTLSRLVDEFLMHLPSGDEPHDLTPTVRRLLGAASGGSGQEEYHDYLEEKYR